MGPHFYHAWTNALRRTPRALLWLLEFPSHAAANLALQAAAAGVRASRLRTGAARADAHSAPHPMQMAARLGPTIAALPLRARLASQRTLYPLRYRSEHRPPTPSHGHHPTRESAPSLSV